MSSSLSTSNYYKMLLQKNFTSYQVIEVFMFIFVGGLLIYAGMQLHKDHEIMLDLCRCRGKLPTTKEGGLLLSMEEADELEAKAIEDSKKVDVPSNNTLGWLLILMGVGTILLGLYRLFMKGAVAE